jgi:hypothetical protein
MKALRFVFLIPAFPLILILAIALLAKLIKENGVAEVMLKIEMDGALLSEDFKNEFHEKYFYVKPFMYASATFGWFLIFKHFVL